MTNTKKDIDRIIENVLVAMACTHFLCSILYALHSFYSN